MELLDPFEPRSSPPPPPQHIASTSLENKDPSSRKRSYLHLDRLDSYPSSDPACFSSDPPEASEDNYSIAPRKRQFKGSWWNHDSSPVAKDTHRSPFARKGRRFRRDFDSGVFMASDGSDGSLPDVGPIQLSPLNKSKRRPVTAEDYARDIVEACVRHDSEVVDLSDLGLEFLDGEGLAALHTITKTSKVIERSEGNLQDDDYQPLQPQLQLYLANNTLHRLPQSLWNLDRLTVLSIRNNGINYLPPAIAKLHNLIELNLANNQLERLPWELVRNMAPYGALEKLIVSNNPLVRPKTDVRQALAITARGIVGLHSSAGRALSRRHLPNLEQMNEVYDSAETASLHAEMLDMCDRHCPVHENDTSHGDGALAISAPDIYCSSVSATHFYDDSGLEIPPGRVRNLIALQQDVNSPQPATSRVPSLFDISMRYYVTLFGGLEDDLDDWHLSERVKQALLKASEINEQEGMRNCSICGRQYLIARTSWVEYCHRLTVGAAGFPVYVTDDLFLPMVRQGCSWSCLPDPKLRKMQLPCHPSR